MTLSHIEFCISSCSYAAQSATKPVQSRYKRELNILDRKPFAYHHCETLQKYKSLNFTNFKSVCLVYKVLNGLAPPPMNESIHLKSVCARLEPQSEETLNLCSV